MKEKVAFLPLQEIDSILCEKLNQITGKCFDNNCLNINFNGLCNKNFFDNDLFLFRIDNVGLNGEFYVCYSEMRRMLKVDVRMLDPLYIEYVFTRSMGVHGIKFMRCIKANEKYSLPPLIMATARLDDAYYSILCDVHQLCIEPEFLRGRKCHFPSSLKLSFDVIVSEVLIDTQDVIDLSNEDLVLLSNK